MKKFDYRKYISENKFSTGLSIEKDLIIENNDALNEDADPNKFKKGFVEGDNIINDTNAQYVLVQNGKTQYMVYDNGVRIAYNRSSSMTYGPKLKGNLGLADIKKS